MTKYQQELLSNLGITVKHFEILEDVLSEITESRVYQDGEDKKALNELKEFFSYSHYKDYRDFVKEQS